MCMEISMVLHLLQSRTFGIQTGICFYIDVFRFFCFCFFLSLKDICSAGQHCVLDIDVEGVKSLKAYMANQEAGGPSFFLALQQASTET